MLTHMIFMRQVSLTDPLSSHNSKDILVDAVKPIGGSIAKQLHSRFPAVSLHCCSVPFKPAFTGCKYRQYQIHAVFKL